MHGASELVCRRIRRCRRARHRSRRSPRDLPHLPEREPTRGRLRSAIIAAARAASVRRFVYHSVLHPQIKAMPHHWAKLLVEEMLLTARPHDDDSPADRLHAEHPGGLARHRRGGKSIASPIRPTPRISLVDLRDVAEAAARVLTEDGHHGATYELVGTDALSDSSRGRRSLGSRRRTCALSRKP